MQPDLTQSFLELVRLAATDLPPDVEALLERPPRPKNRAPRRAARWKPFSRM